MHRIVRSSNHERNNHFTYYYRLSPWPSILPRSPLTVRREESLAIQAKDFGPNRYSRLHRRLRRLRTSQSHLPVEPVKIILDQVPNFIIAALFMISTKAALQIPGVVAKVPSRIQLNFHPHRHHVADIRRASLSIHAPGAFPTRIRGTKASSRPYKRTL